MPKDKNFTWKGADQKTLRDEKVVTNPELKYAYGTVTKKYIQITVLCSCSCSSECHYQQNRRKY